MANVVVISLEEDQKGLLRDDFQMYTVPMSATVFLRYLGL
jgi:hypothetical protein